jgi:hypothetical protein
LRRASSAAGGRGLALAGRGLGARSWRLYTLANFDESEQRGWHRAAGGWRLAGSWEPYTLANFEEAAGGGRRAAGGWWLAAG